MKFRTEINLKKGEYPFIDYQSCLFLIGSCFSDNIGELFKKSKFSILTNPFGVTYNPASIQKQLVRIATKDYFSENDVIQKGELFNAFDLHGSFDSPDKSALIENANSAIDTSHDFIAKCSHIYITLGTSWVYRLNDTNEIVNNCHKLKASIFTRSMLDAVEISSICTSIIDTIRQINEHCHLIFTISPVRHLKDGFRENFLSKSTLRVGIEKVIGQIGVTYFPSYEMAMDDLRDYRFYERDLVHLNQTAIDYIWTKITEVQMSEDTKSLMKECYKLSAAINHRPFNKETGEFKSFVSESLNKAKDLQQKLKSTDFRDEIEFLEGLLSE